MEGGWPLGLQRMNRRIGLDMFGSASFRSLLTSSATFASPVTTSSSSSFEHYTEGIEGDSLVGAAGMINLPRRSFGTPPPPPRQHISNEIKQGFKKHRTWWHHLCSKPVYDDDDDNDDECYSSSTMKATMTKMSPRPSLGYLLEEERRAMGIQRR